MSDDGGVANQRSEKSLGLLTSRFVKLLQEAKGGIVDLKTAADTLDVKQKRRIYDITNVLEGIGLILKISKNIIQWKGGGGEDDTSDMTRQTVELQQELTGLEQEELALDESSRILQHSLKNLAENRHSVALAYISHYDVRTLPCFEEKTLIAFKAPSGTELAVPEPHLVRAAPRFTLHLRSDGRGPIDALLLCDDAFDADLPPLPTAASMDSLGGLVSSNSVVTASVVIAAAAAAAGGAEGITAEGSGDPFLPFMRRDDSVSVPKRARSELASHGGPAVRLSPPPSDGDYVYQMHRDEGIVDLFAMSQ